MSSTTYGFFHSLALVVTLILFSAFITRQASARQLQPLHFPLNPRTQPGMPGWAAPSLHRPPVPLHFPGFQEPVPPHFLPLFPFPGMPTMPSMPSMPSVPAGSTYPSMPTVPSGPAFPSLPSDAAFPSLPSDQSQPSTPTAPTAPAAPEMTPRDVQPAFPEPSATLIEDGPGTRTIPFAP